MKNKQKKKFVYMDLYQNEKGFTLASTLLALLVIAVTVPLIAPLIKAVNMEDHYDTLSVQRFFSYIHHEATKAESWDVQENKLVMQLQDDETATFEKSGQRITRRMKGGYELYLYDVHEVTFEPLPYGVHIIITTLERKQYAKTIVFP